MGRNCEILITTTTTSTTTTTRPTTTVITTTPVPSTTPTTKISKEPATPVQTNGPVVKSCAPVNNCSQHYACDSFGNQVCAAGWTGRDCGTQIVNGPADCSVYDCK